MESPLDPETISRMKAVGIERPEGTSQVTWDQVQGVSPTHMTIAHMAAAGARAAEIADYVGMSPSHVAVVLKSEAVRLEIKRIQHRLFSRDHQKRFRLMMHSAMDVHEQILLDPNVKPGVRLNAVDMIYDRSEGKAKQQIEHSGSLLKNLIEALDRSPAIDVTPKDAQAAEDIEFSPAAPPTEKAEVKIREDFDGWLDENFTPKTTGDEG